MSLKFKRKGIFEARNKQFFFFWEKRNMRDGSRPMIFGDTHDVLLTLYLYAKLYHKNLWTSDSIKWVYFVILCLNLLPVQFDTFVNPSLMLINIQQFYKNLH